MDREKQMTEAEAMALSTEEFKKAFPAYVGSDTPERLQVSYFA